MLSLSGRSVLVTGGAGFIGSHLVDRILGEEPGNVVVVDNLFLGKERNLEAARREFPGLRFYKADVSDFETMAGIMAAEAIDVAFDLAVVPLPTSLERPRWTVDVNVACGTVMCELLRTGHYRTLVRFSSSEVYGTAQRVPMDEAHPLVPSTPYAASKAAGDHVALSYQRAFGLDVAVVRPFNCYGPRQNEGAYAGVIPVVVRRALVGEPVAIHGDGEQTRDFTFVADLVDAAVRVYEQPETRGLVLNIASQREVSVATLVHTVLRLLDVDVPVVHEPPRPGDVRRHCGSMDRAAQLIGLRPCRSLDEGLVDTIAWYRELLSEPEESRVG
ncbi:MAG TPA: NAD-dependent epimerase/dehydratase family protein [Acidimicrobiales bacterium]|nr:NAD-dependent epimerase/dehydratase family protein [Acidimicrobiales bacterium]